MYFVPNVRPRVGDHVTRIVIFSSSTREQIRKCHSIKSTLQISKESIGKFQVYLYFIS